MNDTIDFIDELKELQSLYNTGDLRNFDFERMIQKYERKADAYDTAMDKWFRETYTPVNEV